MQHDGLSAKRLWHCYADDEGEAERCRPAQEVSGEILAFVGWRAGAILIYHRTAMTKPAAPGTPKIDMIPPEFRSNSIDMRRCRTLSESGTAAQ
jgi:hypothetical protein